MARTNTPMVAFNRGLIDSEVIARVDIDRTRLSAEVMTNWLPVTQGPMYIRPGTKYIGSGLNDTGAAWLEFIASTNDVALIEVTHHKMRVWLGENSHSVGLLSRPLVATTLSASDTGWSNTSTGGNASGTSYTSVLPTMTAETTNGVTITDKYADIAGSEPWRVAEFIESGDFWVSAGAYPHYLNVKFTNAVSVARYTMQASFSLFKTAIGPDNPPTVWNVLRSNFDTGTYATDTGKWNLADTGAVDSWPVNDVVTENISSPSAYKIYRFMFKKAADTGNHECGLYRLDLFSRPSGQFDKNPAGLVFNASSIGALARGTKRVIVDTGDRGVEHSLAINVNNGPVTCRVGSTMHADNYIRETQLGTGVHNLAFTPSTDFYISLQSSAITNKTISSIGIGDSGTLELTAPWTYSDLGNIRYDQSADVVYVDCAGVEPKKIERRGTGRSWSIVDYAPSDGPFFATTPSDARLKFSAGSGDITITSDVQVFNSDHVGGLIRAFHEGESGTFKLGAVNAMTDAATVVGIGDTGTKTAQNERRIVFAVTGTYIGRIDIERSVDGPDVGFTRHTTNTGATTSDTGTFTATIDDKDDNLKVWYRARLVNYTSGVAQVKVTNKAGGTTGVARISSYISNTSVNAEVLKRFADTGGTDNWQFGYWSPANGYPSAVALHGGRLVHANNANVFLSVADDYESFDEEVEGDAGPIIRTLGSGPVDNIYYVVSLLRLILGTAGAEIAVKSTSLDEPLTPTKASARAFSTQGSANIRALKMDNRAVFVQRSEQRLFAVGFALQGDTISEYQTSELTKLIPELMKSGIVSIAIQRQPDTRIHCVLGDGRVAILVYEPDEEVIAWCMWETAGSVENVVILPGQEEDAVYYYVRRTINGLTKRYLEKWALRSETRGDTGLHYLADCAKSYTDTGRTATLTGFSHLAGKEVVVWADDTGQALAGKDLSPGYGDAQTTYIVDTGAGTVTLNEAVHHAVAGLPFQANWKSTKLAYSAEAGTALTQMKRTDKLGFVFAKTHNRGVQFGSDTGHLDPLPLVIDNGAQVDPDKIFEHFDQAAMPFPGLWDTDSRIHIRASAPRPVTVAGIVPTVQTNEKV